MDHRDAYHFGAQTPEGLERPFQRQDKLHEPLYVVTPIFNPMRFRSRWKLYADFAKMCAEAGAILYTIEVAFGDRDFVVTDPKNLRHIQLRTLHELWLKEQLINLAVQRLPLDWKYVAWVDADCHFARYDWADETRHLLQRYPVVQMWSQLHDLNADHELVGSIRSFADVWVEMGSVVGGNPPPQEVAKLGHHHRHHHGHHHHHRHRHRHHPHYPCPGPVGEHHPHVPGEHYPPVPMAPKPIPGYPGAPGLAWAMRREAWDQLGGLIDYSILGAGDWYMAHALTGQLSRIVRPEQGRMGQMFLEWEDRARKSLWAERPILGNLGVMKGMVQHYWHGPKVNRLYQSREQILARSAFDPELDLKRDWQGLYQVTNRKPQLRRDLQWYFSQRNEDALT